MFLIGAQQHCEFKRAQLHAGSIIDLFDGTCDSPCCAELLKRKSLGVLWLDHPAWVPFQWNLHWDRRSLSLQMALLCFSVPALAGFQERV